MSNGSKDFALAKYERDREHEVALNEFTHNLEVEQLKLLVLLNGGAATALLAFAEKAVAPGDLPRLTIPLGLWFSGLVVGAWATITMRYAQSRFAKFYRHRRHVAEFHNGVGEGGQSCGIAAAELRALRKLAEKDSALREAVNKPDCIALHERLAALSIDRAFRNNRIIYPLSLISLLLFVAGVAAAAAVILYPC